MCAAGVLRSMLAVTAGSRPSAAAFSASSFFQVQMHPQKRGTHVHHVHAVQYVVQFVRSLAVRNAALILDSFGCRSGCLKHCIRAMPFVANSLFTLGLPSEVALIGCECRC